jgi:hypothetical protein
MGIADLAALSTSSVPLYSFAYRWQACTFEHRSAFRTEQDASDFGEGTRLFVSEAMRHGRPRAPEDQPYARAKARQGHANDFEPETLDPGGPADLFSLLRLPRRVKLSAMKFLNLVALWMSRRKSPIPVWEAL